MTQIFIIVGVLILLVVLTACGIKSSKSKPNENNVNGEEHWENYPMYTEDGIVLNFVNMNAMPENHADYPYRHLVNAKYPNEHESGLPIKEHLENLYEIEDVLLKIMGDDLNGIFVGRSTHGGQRIFCFYMSSKEKLKPEKIENQLGGFKDFNFEHTVLKDENWDFYREFLYPSPEEKQIISNQRVIEALEESGDHLQVARDVDHWIYFKEEEKREEYFSKVEKEGFLLREKTQTDDGEFGLQIYRKDSVDHESIDATVLFLFGIAQEMGATYDGWETEIIKDDMED